MTNLIEINDRLTELEIANRNDRFSEHIKSSGEPPDMTLEARVAKLEASVLHIESDIKDIRSDLRDIRSELSCFRKETRSEFSCFRKETVSEFSCLRKDMVDGFNRQSRDREFDFRLLFGALIAVALGLAGMMAKGFGWFN